MIRVYRRGRLGNALFQHTFGRILHHETGQALINNELIEGIPEAKNLQGTINHHMTHVADWGENEGKLLEIDSLVKLGTGFALDGFFQHRSYYEERRDQIKSWLFGSSITRPDTLAVHVRLDDYTDIGWSLPESYYNSCINQSSCKNLLVFTDQHDHPYIKSLRSQGAELSNLSPVEDLKLMSSCQEIIMSRSSYSWWAAFLSSSKRVYFPRPSFGWWSLKDTPHKDLLLSYPEYTEVSI